MRQPQAVGGRPAAKANPNRGSQRRTLRFQLAAGLCWLVACHSGCSSFGLGNAKLVQDLQAENDRLLAEFRAERDRREDLEHALRRTENRLAESEKLLAQRYAPRSGSSTNTARVSNSSPLPALGNRGGSAGFDNSTADDSGLRWQRRVSN